MQNIFGSFNYFALLCGIKTTKNNKTMTTAQSFSLRLRSNLIETMNTNSDVQLRKSNDSFIMVSPTTGIHTIKATSLTERVKLHWEGFQKNQLP